MNKVLFASTATAALLLGGMASAQGISLFGSARLGLTYIEDRDDNVNRDELEATSRVRFGVNMTGETNSGITFGASVQAHEAVAANNGGLDGNVFVSGSLGTLTFGDTAGADENWVGDVPGNRAFAGVGDENETPFVSNGGGVRLTEEGGDGLQTFKNPFARPTVRYDYDLAGFGISLSTNRTLSDVGVGAGYAGDFGDVSFNVAVGYYDFDTFTSGENEIASGDQISASMGAGIGDIDLGVVWQKADNDGGEYETIHVGATVGLGAVELGGWYSHALTAEAGGEELARDGEDSYGISGRYDLGGGAVVAAGLADTFEGKTRADFGIRLSF